MKKNRFRRKRLQRTRKQRSVQLKAIGITRYPMPACEERKSTGKVIIFKSEQDYIHRCILDYPDIETGGQLFGYWTATGVPVVMYAIGPGPQANHQTAFFNQDVDYLVTIGRFLKERYGLHHIGEWHSHHRLGLARPSGHDAHTMNSTIREKGLGRFLLCIGNLNGFTPTVGAFLCDGERCSQVEWETIAPASPIRHLVDRELERILVHPRSSLLRRENSTGRGTLPEYAPGYWLRSKENRVILNEIINFVKENCGFPNPEVRVLLNEKGEVALCVEQFGEARQKILFPIGFPSVAPIIKARSANGTEQIVSDAGWMPEKKLPEVFYHYYKRILI